MLSVSTAATNVARRQPRPRRRAILSEADRHIAREACAAAWTRSLVENDGRVVDQTKFLIEQAALGNGSYARILAAAKDDDDDNVMMTDVATTRRTIHEPSDSVCSMCGYLPNWDASVDACVKASQITTLVSATHFHSVECAREYYCMGLDPESAHLLPAILARIDSAFSALVPAAKQGGDAREVAPEAQQDFVQSMQEAFGS